MERFYDRIPNLECLSGDTLDVFNVHVNDFGDLTGCTMQVLLEDQKAIGNAAFVKTCDPVEGGFQVQLTSTDTEKLNGVYNMHFCMKDAESRSYRKLAGILYIRRTAQGV